MTKNDAPEPDVYFDVFISYSQLDVAHAEALERKLATEDLKVWRDKPRLEAGDHVVPTISVALRNSSAVVVLWSDNATKSRWVQKEADYAEVAGKYLPLAIDGFDYGMLDAVFRDYNCGALAAVLADAGAIKQRVLALRSASHAGQQVRHADIRPVPGFIGRAEMLGLLKEKLWQGSGKSTVAIRNASGGIIAMRGLGGVGKTVLARHYAWEKREAYHGIWWLRAEAHDMLVNDLVALGRQIGLHFADYTEPEDAAQQTLDRIAQGRTPKPWLLVYDNVEDKTLLRRFTPPEGAHLLYTTRLSDWFGEADELPVDVFPRETAIDFLLAYVPGETRETAGQLADALGRLPLALAQARAYCRTRCKSFDRYREQLAGLLDTMPKGADTDYPRTVYATFSLAMDRASVDCGGAQRLMGLIAHFAPDQIPIWLIPETVMSEVERDDALEVLRRLSLVAHDTQADGTTAISVHRLVQEVVRARLREAGKAKAFAALAVQIIEPAYDDSGAHAATAKNAAWLPHALAILALAPREGDVAWHTLWTCNQIGDFRVCRGELSRAKEAYETGMKIVEELATASPDNTRWQRDVSVSLNKIADVLRAAGDANGALANYQKSLAIFEALAAADPHRPEWQRDVSVSLNKIADVLLTAGDTNGALANYQKSLDIAEALAATDPRRPEWQRDVSVSSNKIADVLRAAGDTNGALANYQKSLDIFEALAAADPHRPEWQRDVSVSLEKIADVLRAAGDAKGALANCQKSLAIREALAAADPHHVGWQRDVAISHGRVAMIEAKHGQAEDALVGFSKGRDIIVRLMSISLGYATLPNDLAWFQGQIAALEGSPDGGPTASTTEEPTSKRGGEWRPSWLGGGKAP